MISSSAFEKLTAMGIPLYQLKEATSNDQASDYLAIDSDALTASQLYLDILSVLAVNQSEVTISENTVDLGLYLWHFHDKQEVTLDKQVLLTPSIAELAKLPALKRALWLALSADN